MRVITFVSLESKGNAFRKSYKQNWSKEVWLVTSRSSPKTAGTQPQYIVTHEEEKRRVYSYQMQRVDVHRLIKSAVPEVEEEAEEELPAELKDEPGPQPAPRALPRRVRRAPPEIKPAADRLTESEREVKRPVRAKVRVTEAPKDLIKAIHGTILFKGVKAYHTEWVGYPNKVDWTFEPARNIKHTDVFRQYIKTNKSE